MKKSVMLKWVKALRSGQYKQGQQHLKFNNNYCCLGVLCELSKLGEFQDISCRGDYGYLGHDTVLPQEVLDYAGITHPTALFVNGRGITKSLTTLNDNGRSFKQIANVIKRYWKEL